ncbi:MAG: hypothetical protein ACXWNJ_18275 [Vulcanimicrobiaceae bacterium]
MNRSAITVRQRKDQREIQIDGDRALDPMVRAVSAAEDRAQQARADRDKKDNSRYEIDPERHHRRRGEAPKQRDNVYEGNGDDRGLGRPVLRRQSEDNDYDCRRQEPEHEGRQNMHRVKRLGHEDRQYFEHDQHRQAGFPGNDLFPRIGRVCTRASTHRSMGISTP